MIHICIRQTLNWQHEGLVDAQILPEFRPKYEAWNATFTMPYHVFRQRLKAIAELNFSRVEGAVCSRVDEVPRGHIIVPTDDDDWFAPDLATRLRRAHERAAAGYLWRRGTLQYESPTVRARSRLARLIARREKFICKTNNYAVPNERELAPLALNHVRASAYFAAHPAEVKRIPATLAIQNRTLASQTALAWRRPTIGRKALGVLLEKHRALYAAWKPATTLLWAKPYVALMNELMAEIDVR